jgi:DNA recombination protein RmuC
MNAWSVALLIVVTLALGGLLGWLFGSRQSAGERRTSEMLKLQRDELVQERDTLRSERDAAELARAELAADARSFETRMSDLQKSRDELTNQFREVGDSLLKKAHTDFLEKAGERFSEADRASETKLKELLAPVETTLKRYEEGLKKVETDRIDQYAGLKAVVEQVRDGQGRVRDETRKLVNALTASSKVRGNWGEQSLRNVLELAGLSPYADFKSEVSVTTEEGRLRPDVIVRLPGGGQMVIDSKISFNSYMSAHHEVDDEKRETHLQAHLASIKSHVNKLSSKAYWDQFEGSAEFVVMYVAGEHFLHAAVDLEPELWQWAMDKKVLLATPTNLLALAQTAALYWRHDVINREAQEIAEQARELHKRFCTMTEHMEKLGRNFAIANSAYNAMVGSLNEKLVPQLKKFEEFGAGSPKSLANVPSIDSVPKIPFQIVPEADVGFSDRFDGGEPPQIAAE